MSKALILTNLWSFFADVRRLLWLPMSWISSCKAVSSSLFSSRVSSPLTVSQAWTYIFFWCKLCLNPYAEQIRCTRCSPEVLHKILSWLYKSCCCNHASGGRSGWPWAWREPPVSLQEPVHANSNVVSVSDYFHTDNYGVLTRRTACHNKILLCKRWKLC